MTAVSCSMVHVASDELVRVAVVFLGVSLCDEILELLLLIRLAFERPYRFLQRSFLLVSLQEAFPSHDSVIRVLSEVESVRELAV